LNIRELVFAERRSQIPELSRESAWIRGLVISQALNAPFNWPEINEYLQKFEDTKSEIDREEREKHEAQLKENERQVEAMRKELLGMVKQIRCWQTPWGERVEVDGKMDWQRLSISMIGDETVMKRTQQSVCPRKGEKLDLANSLDNVLDGLARDIVSGSMNKPSLLELDRMLSRVDSLDAHCGVISANECLGIKSEFGDHCHTISLKLVPK